MSFFCDKKFYEWRESTASSPVIISVLTVQHEKKCDNYKLHPENNLQISSKICLLKTNTPIEMNKSFNMLHKNISHLKELNIKRDRHGLVP